jgi:hypothetical protein
MTIIDLKSKPRFNIKSKLDLDLKSKPRFNVESKPDLDLKKGNILIIL